MKTKTLHERFFPKTVDIKYNPLVAWSSKNGLKKVKKWQGKGYICTYKSLNEGHRIFTRPVELE